MTSRETWLHVVSRIVMKLRKILVFSDLHASRITLATAEFLVVIAMWHRPSFEVQAYLEVMSAYLWTLVLLSTVSGQIYFLMRGSYHTRPAVWFAGWNALLWISFSVITYVIKSEFPSLELALTCSASWIFIRSGFPVYGNRSSDYAVRHGSGK